MAFKRDTNKETQKQSIMGFLDWDTHKLRKRVLQHSLDLDTYRLKERESTS